MSNSELIALCAAIIYTNKEINNLSEAVEKAQTIVELSDVGV